ncbi:sterol desaturase family protein [[Mycobacterium] burgundiense]|uniref:Sterol desaturase family protein n=1 Tax=[Mycobacterium] burgundiense TaxID=3064286 RepID=A0ABM9LR16_9MYCO|nr:sterol desaturase family protein [Mycolicibacterium sp. MU0053]CAJ1503335.1 sterol desaturase family protein [Mycolicibacterium sp. MU0053]
MTKSRKEFTLDDAVREFVRHPTPWMIAAALATASTLRLLLGDWQPTDALIPLAMLAAFPFVEWIIHVVILHWRPRRIAGLVLDPLLARKHREHHVDPRRVELIFIPWQALLWVLPAAVILAVVVFARLELALTFVAFLAALGLVYEWMHYLIHADYKPRSAVYKAIWRNHRQHHFKNEKFWFTVTSAGTADRVLGTGPDPRSVPTSPTAKNLHALNP